MSTKNIADAYPLSPMQQGMLFHSLYAPTSGIYVEQLSFELHGELNVAAFEQAWQQVVARHSILRTAFVWEKLEKPIQVVGRQVKLPFKQLDWQTLSPVEQQAHLAAFLHADQQQGFELTRAPLMRLTLIQLAENSYQFIWSHHHLLLDGWSSPILLKEVIAFYEAFRQNQNLYLEQPRPYRDYIAWLQQQDVSQAEMFWRQLLKGFTSPTSVRVNRNFNSVSSEETGRDRQQIKLSTVTTAALQSLARQHQLTLSTLVQGAWALLLSRYSGEEDVVFGATVSGRPPDLAGSESMVGLFINTLPVRMQVSPTSLLSWLKQLQTQQVDARQYEYSRLIDIQGWSDVPRGLPLFESIVVFENYPVDASLQEQLSNLEIRNIRSVAKTNYPLTVLAAVGSELSLEILSDSSTFDAATVTRTLGHLQTLLEAIANNPHQRLLDLPILTKSEQYQLLVEWNNTQTNYPKDKCIHQLFEIQVERSREAIAVIFEDQHLTYRELNARANRLAHHLRSLGVGPEVLVGICVERSLEMVVGLLGILKAGGAFVPLDPSYPQERLAFMLENSQTPVLLTQRRLSEGLPEYGAKVVCLDTDWEAIAQECVENPISGVEAVNPAYVIYTSGSTGKPKGVINTHQGVCNRLLWMQDAYQLTQADRVLQKTSFSFDVSVWEFFWPLSLGAQLIVARPEGHKDSAYLAKLVAEQQITTLHFVPSMLLLFLEEQGLEMCSCLKRVICSGEALPLELQERFFARLGAKLHNLYGPTEAAIDVTFWACEPESNQRIVPIGRPIANTQIYLLDVHLQPVPIGVPGELHIGGIGLARGYHKRPDLTVEKFIPNPFSDEPGTRLYKTGDLARYRQDGTIEFLGRIDHQVKIRGFRIELGEIETVLSQHPGVRAIALLAREDEPDNKRLVAYIVPREEQTPTLSELRSFLKQKLPDYMVPSAFVMLDALPLTPNGKVNRSLLTAPSTTKHELQKPFAEPRTPIEEVLAAIWLDILGLEQVGIHDNFFELGGHSLLGTQVISRVRSTFQVELPLRCLFESPTVAQLSARIEKAMKAEQGVETLPIERISRDRNLPLSFAQQRLWFLDQLEPNNTAYNIPAAVRVSGSLNVAALEQSLNEIVRRHEVLRTTFTVLDGQSVQAIAPTLTLKLPVVDLQFPETEREAEVLRLAAQEAKLPFDLAQGPLLRAKLLKLGISEHVVLLTMHHIVSDAWSEGVLIRDLVVLYEALSSGKPSPLLELPIQYADFAVWQRQWLQGAVLEALLSYWQRQLDSLPTLQLPTDHPRPAVQTFRGSQQSLVLPKTLSETLKVLSVQEGVTLFMTLLAAFQTLLHWYTGQDDIVVGTDVANRNRAETEGLIGFFVNQLVLRTDLSGNPTFRELLLRVREVSLGAYAHQDLPFNKLVEVLNPGRDFSRMPLFQVKLILQNAPMPTLELSGLTFSPLKADNETAEFDLLLNLVDTEQGLVGTFNYNTDLFGAASITRMLGNFETLLRHIGTQPETKLNDLKTILVEADKQQQITKEQAYQKTIQKLMNIKRKSINKS